MLKLIKLFYPFIYASAPILLLLLIIRYNGTTKSEYWSHFEEVEGKLIGPYTIIKKSPHFIINDTLEHYDLTLHDHIYDSLVKYDLKDSLFNKFRDLNIYETIIKPGITIDSVQELTQTKWDALNAVLSTPVTLLDTVLISSEYIFPLKIGRDSSLTIHQYFMVDGSPYRFALSTFNRSGKVTDLMNMSSIYRSRSRKSKNFETWDEYSQYDGYLDSLFQNETDISITKYKGECKSCLVYRIEDEWGTDLFYDDEAFEVLRYTEKRFGFNITKPDMRFILWYENWFVIILLLMEAGIIGVFAYAFFKR